jgi:hypothetical protein
VLVRNTVDHQKKKSRDFQIFLCWNENTFFVEKQKEAKKRPLRRTFFSAINLLLCAFHEESFKVSLMKYSLMRTSCRNIYMCLENGFRKAPLFTFVLRHKFSFRCSNSNFSPLFDINCTCPLIKI